MKKQRKKLSKLFILLFAFSIFSLYGIQDKKRVTIIIPNKDYIDFSKYSKVIFQKYDFKLPDINIKYKKIFGDFFFIEFQKSINKKVDFINDKLINTDLTEKETDNDDKNLILDENIKTNYSDTIIISIKMVLKIDKRHVISEKTDKYGDKEKRFVEKIVWRLKTNIGLVDINSGKILKKILINKKITKEEGSTKQFNFKFLFDATMNDFLKKLMKKEHIERRYLLSQLNLIRKLSIMRNS